MGTLERKWTYLRWKRCNLIVLGHIWKQELLFAVNKIWPEWFEDPKPIWHHKIFLSWNGPYLNELEWKHKIWRQRGFIGDWKGVIQMHWVAKIHLESKGVSLNMTCMFVISLKALNMFGAWNALAWTIWISKQLLER